MMKLLVAADKGEFGISVVMLPDSIDQLRRAGKTDAEIAQLLEEDGGLNVCADALTQFYAAPVERRRPG
jgi:hypothetical protein